ncbi:unnamed protein product [Darwinula stevensoni]|uniref:H/ACA ribonucleoprotein complex subunit 2 n=1 Tax=Darwinula stevensoni TaxID=69355 RepID=A0A7R8X2K8_9CRUS|nr:unnamed protein product [Darwinula stevensoni]CAG0881579.1 unnamed protein product [Darwinula stevensoni]
MGKKSKEKNLDSTADESMLDASQCEETGGDAKPEMSYEEKLQYVSIIAKPMASRKLAKKLFKVIKKASKHKTYLRNGLKDVQSRIRKGERGLVVFAGDVTPIEVMCHLPAVCEDKDIPYCYVPAKQDLGSAMGVKRGSLMVLVKQHSDYEDLFNECSASVRALPHPY